MKVKTILVSQPEPKMENSPYLRLIEKEHVRVDFRPFIHVEGVEAKSVQATKNRSKGLYCYHFNEQEFGRPFFPYCRGNEI